MAVKYLLVLLLPLLPFSALAQTRVLTERVDTVNHLASEDDGTFGANKLYFASFYTSIGVPINNLEDGFWQLRGSAFDLGVYYKLKISGLLSLTADGNYRRLRNSFNPSIISVPESTLMYKKVVVHQFNVGFGPRINFDVNRGNSLGKYLDLRVFSSYLYGLSQKTKHNNYGNIITTRSNYGSLENRLYYGAEAILGSGNFGLKLTYLANSQVNKFFVNDYVLPTLTVGLQLGFST